MALAPNATTITVREVLAKLETDFAAVARAVENGEFALWVGSGISRRAPNLGDLIERAFEYVRVRTIDPATANDYRPALQEALDLAGIAAADVEAQFDQPLAVWPEHDAIINALWNNYSRVLDIRIPGKVDDFILWEAINIREAFVHPAEPAAEHLCIAILMLEGAIRTVASANWDGFIEAAVARLSSGVDGVMQIVVDPDQLRGVAGRARLLKFHGCILYATQEPLVFRQYLTGSRTQIMEWPEKALFAAMRNAIVDLATNQKALVLGLSIQDNNLQTIFTRAREVHAWPWPCAPDAPAHVFCEDEIKQGQRDVLRLVYPTAYNGAAAAIHAGSHLRAWGEQVLIALVLKLLTDKLARLMELDFAGIGKDALSADLVAMLSLFRGSVADLAVGDRTDAVNRGIAVWSRLLAIFRTGRLPHDPAAYEALSTATPDLIAGDANAQAMGLGRLGVALALLADGRDAGSWEVGAPPSDALTDGVLQARATRPGSDARPVFLVKSASEAIALQSNGGFANDNAIVVHADQVWHELAGAGSSARRVRAPPGRTGHVGTTHVSLGRLLASAPNAAALRQEFATEMML